MDNKNKINLKRVSKETEPAKDNNEEIIKVGTFKNILAENETEPFVVEDGAEVNNTVTQPKIEEKTEKAKTPFITVKFNKYDKPITEDAKAHKNIAWLAYLLFFIPLCMPTKRNSEFVRFHVNEGLEINIIDLIGILFIILGACIPHTIAWVHLLMMIFTFVGVALLVLTTITKVYMIVITCQGKQISTPWLWEIKIIK